MDGLIFVLNSLIWTEFPQLRSQGLKPNSLTKTKAGLTAWDSWSAGLS